MHSMLIRLKLNLVVLSALLLLLQGCRVSNESKMVGRWSSGKETLEFFSDKTFRTEPANYSGTWTVLEDARIKLNMSSFGTQMLIMGELVGDSLELTLNNTKDVYQRVNPNKSGESRQAENKIIAPEVKRSTEEPPDKSKNESSAVARLRTINTAEVTYLSSHRGVYGTVPDLIADGLLDARFSAPIEGYVFSVVPSVNKPGGPDYYATAIAVSPDTGRYDYVSSADAVVRDSGGAPVGLAGKPGR